MAGDLAVYHDLVRLRRGRALQATKLRTRVGPNLSTVCAVQNSDSDPLIRQKVTRTIGRVAGELPPDLRLAINAALAIDGRARFTKLESRESWLAGQLSCSVRTARRRVEEASARVAEVLAQSAEDRTVDPDQGWHVSHLSATLCLDTPTPELYEQRTILSTRDGLAEVRNRFSLPPPVDPDTANPEVKVLHGARVRATERLGQSHFRYTLALPRPLRNGDSHEYTIMYRLLPGHRMNPHFAFVPLTPCGSFRVRVRFDPGRPPAAVWRLERIAPRLLDEAVPVRAAGQLSVDDAGDVGQHFVDLVQGYGYGIAWRVSGAGAHGQQEIRP